MRVISEQVQAPKATKLVSALLVAMLMVSVLPLQTRAQEIEQNVLTPTEGYSTVQGPSTPPVATSEIDDYNIVWSWGAPEGELTVDTVTSPESPDVELVDNSTDITEFGYQLSKQGALHSAGSVSSDTYSLTTPVSSDGVYTLKVWSITRGGTTSAATQGSITIQTLVKEQLPPIGVEIIPEPIDTSSVINKQASNENPVIRNAPVRLNEEIVTNSLGNGDGQVLSASKSDAEPAIALDTAGIVKSTGQGWVILDVAWYVWLLIVAGLFAAGRGLMALINTR